MRSTGDVERDLQTDDAVRAAEELFMDADDAIRAADGGTSDEIRAAIARSRELAEAGQARIAALRTQFGRNVVRVQHGTMEI